MAMWLCNVNHKHVGVRAPWEKQYKLYCFFYRVSQTSWDSFGSHTSIEAGVMKPVRRVRISVLSNVSIKDDVPRPQKGILDTVDSL